MKFWRVIIRVSRRLAVATIVFLFTLLVFPGHARAIEYIDPNWGTSSNNTAIDVSTKTSGQVKTFNIGEKIYIVWANWATGVKELRLQRLSFDGTKDFGSSGVLLETADDVSNAQVIIFGSGFLLFNYDHVQLFNLEGIPQWTGSGTTLPCTSDRLQFEIDQNSFGVLCEKGYDAGGHANWDILYQRYDQNGSSILPGGNPIVISHVLDIWFDHPIAAKVVGTDLYIASTRNWSVNVHKVDVSGSILWAQPLEIFSGTWVDAYTVYLFPNPEGKFEIFWQDSRGVAGEKFDSLGNKYWGARNGKVLSTGPSFPKNWLVWEGDNVYLPTFYNYSNNYSIKVQKINTSGDNSWGTEKTLISGTNNFDVGDMSCAPYIDYGLYCVVDNPNSRYDILLQGLTTLGNTIFTTPVVVSNAPGNQYFPRVILDSNYGAIANWIDDRSGIDADLYAQRIWLDITSPVTSLSTNPATPNGLDGYYSTTPTITLNSIDTEVSGLKEIKYKWDSGSYQTYSGSISGLEGMHTLWYYAVDNAGNTEAEKQFIIKVNTTPPPTPVVTPPAPVVTLPAPVATPLAPTPTPTPQVLGATTFHPIIRTFKNTTGAFTFKYNGKTISLRPFGASYKGTVWARSIDFGPDGKIYVFINSGPYSKGQIRVYKANGKLLKAYNPYGGFATSGLNATAVSESNDKVYLAVGTTRAGTTVKTYQATVTGLKPLNSLKASTSSGNIRVAFKKLYKNQYGLVTMRGSDRATLKVWKLNLTTNKFVEDKKISKTIIKI